MNNMRIDMTTCQNCSQRMDHHDRQPVTLTLCGHSFCRACLVNIEATDNRIKCPTCRNIHCGPSPQDLPVSLHLMELLETEEDESIINANSPTTSEHLPSAPPGSTNEAPPGSTNEAPPTATSAEPASDDDPQDNPSGTSSQTSTKYLKVLGVAAGAVVGGTGLVAAAPVLLAGAGFTSAGIAAGSWATTMMSVAAGINGGGVAAGGVIATLQSAGAVGIGAGTTALLGTAGGAAGAGVANHFMNNNKGSPNADEEDN